VDTHVPPVTRRTLLQSGIIGGLAAPGAAATQALVGLPQLLAADAARDSHSKRSQPAKSCIFIYQYGGLSQLDSWDPKPHAPAEIRGPYKPISTRTPGFQVGELMPSLAAISDRYCVIRSLSHSVPVHNIANEMLLAGSSKPARNAPSLGAVITRLRPTSAVMPPHVWLQKFGGGAAPAEAAWISGGSLGLQYAPLLVGERHDDNPGTPGYQVPLFQSPVELSEPRLQARFNLLRQLQQPVAATSDINSLQERAFTLLHSPAARTAFQVERESVEMRARYGQHPFGQNLLLARRLIEAGVRLVNVVAWMGLAPNDKFVSVETWDMHGNAGIGIFDNGWNGLGWALPRADASVAALLTDLEDRGLLESTLVVFVGEFGRTPRISRGASAIGRDHWPNCYSGMLAGAGIPGGTVYGASDDTAAWVRERPVSPEDLSATILTALGIDPQTRLSPDGFTQPASTGQPLPFVV
jgi:hypothetical protein